MPYDADSDALGSVLAEHAARHRVPGAALAIVRGDEVEVVVTGVRDARSRAPVTVDTLFEGGSLAKTMGAALALRLARRGVFDLVDTVAASVPELSRAAWAAGATLDDLLSGTSGIPLSAATEFEARFEGADASRRLAEATADGPSSGSGWSYSNAAWSVLARAVEVAADGPWAEVMRSELLDPAGLASTTFGASDTADAAVGHVVHADGPAPVDPDRRACYAPAGLTLRLTAGDLGRLAQLLLTDAVLAGLREPRYDRPIHAWFDAWCRGMARFDLDGGAAWGWSGLTNGQRADLRILPEQGGAVALLTDAGTGRAMFRSLCEELVPRLFGVRPMPLRIRPREVVRIDPAAYVGVYAWPDRSFEVALVDDRLTLTRAGVTRELVPVDERVFVVDRGDPDVPTVTFDRFDEWGRPAVLYVMLWSFPRVWRRSGSRSSPRR